MRRPCPVDRNPSSRLRFALFAGCAGFPIHGIPSEPIREILVPCILRVAGQCAKRLYPTFRIFTWFFCVLEIRLRLANLSLFAAR
jgi:hypothetical protein